MIQFNRPFAAPAALYLLMSGLVGCASGSLGKISSMPDLPKEVSSDKDRFEVKEVVGSPSPVPSPTPNPVLSKKSRKKKKSARPTPTLSGEPVLVPTEAFPVRRPAKEPIWVGEKLTYEITYFGMSAGDFDLEVMPFKAIDNRKVYHVQGTAISSKVFSLFYRLNDMVESFIDFDGVFSHRFHIVLDESKQTRDSLELNDSSKAQTFYWNRWNHKDRGYTENKDFTPMPRFPQDSLSALYYLRTLPLNDGDVVTFPVVSEGKNWEAVVSVLRREVMSTPMGKIRCIVLKPETKYQGVLQKKGDSFIWLTDDDRKYLVRLEAKVRIGTVVGALKKAVPGTPP